METTLPTAPIKVFFDGSCPLCVAETDFIRTKDTHNQLMFIDASRADFKPEDFQLQGITQQDCMRELIAQSADGTIYRALATFRMLYATIGLAQAAAWTNWPLLHRPIDALYRWFARNRHWLPISGLVSMFERRTQQILEKQADEAFAQRQTCHDGVCEIPITGDKINPEIIN